MKTYDDTTPTVLGEISVDKFTGGHGSQECELSSATFCLKFFFSTEYHGTVESRAALAGLLNAAIKTLYDFDKEMAANDGKYPEGMSVSIASDIDILLRTAIGAFGKPFEK